MLVVTFAAVAANALLYFVYLPETSSVSTNDPGVGAKSNHSEGFPRLERRGEIYATPNTLPAPAGDPTVVTLGDHAFEDGTASEFAERSEVALPYEGTIS